MTQLDNTTNQKLPIVGILGDGQLSMMMIQAYQKLGGKVFAMGATDDGPASAYADQLFVGDADNLKDLTTFFAAVDVVTLENEFSDGRLLGEASKAASTPVYPEPNRFALIEDKLSEKRFFQSAGVRLAEFFEVGDEQDLLDAPGYLKLAKGGYDGIGTYRVNNRDEALAIYQKIKSAGPILFEHAIAFKKELSLIAVSDSKETVFYPLVETHQEAGTCRYVTYPSGVSEAVEQDARAQVGRIMQELNTRGLFAFELFLTQDDQLILNESAPRPHNSGHITLDLMDCSQFENHMRSIAGMDLKQPQLMRESMTMLNLLGTKDGDFNAPQLIADIDDSNASATLYEKKQSRVKRKMGHINVWGDKQMQRAQALVARLEV